MRSRLLFALATVVAFVLLTLAWASPLLPVMRTGYLSSAGDASQLGRADALLTSWMLAWGSHALRTDPLRLFHANIFYPLPWTLAFSENLVASAALLMPIDLAWGDPVLDHNVLVLASFALCGIGTALLVRELGGGWPAAWLAGALVAFNPFRFRTIGHVHSLSSHWMPFALLALQCCLRRGRGAVWVAFTVLLVTLSSVYYAYFFLIALAVFVPAHWLLGAPAAPGGRRRAIAGILVAALVTAAFLVPYKIARDIYVFARDSGQAWFFAAKGTTYLGSIADPAGYLTQRYLTNDSTVVLGPATLLLALAGLARGAAPERGGRRTTAAYLLMGIALALVSLGPLLQWSSGFGASVPGPWVLLSAVVPGFAALRVAPRAGTITILAVAVLAAFGAQALWARAHGVLGRAAVLALLLAIGVLESWRGPFGIMAVPWGTDGVPPVYRWLAMQPGNDAVLELPIGLPLGDASYMVLSAAHWKPLVNGYSGFTPTTSFFRNAMIGFPGRPAVRLLHQLGVRWVVAHPPALPPGLSHICEMGTTLGRPNTMLAYRDPIACVFEIRTAPAPMPVRPDRPVSLAGATVATSAGTDAGAAIDGRLDTHWVEAVSPTTETWLELDLPEPHALTRLAVELGPHFGEFMRRWRVDGSLDGITWEPLASEFNAVPPVVDMRNDPAHLTTEMRLDPTKPARYLRLVRLGAGDHPSMDLWGNWKFWGVHELAVFEDAP